MKVIVVGFGIQGKKRMKFAGADFVATVDPVNPNADYDHISKVPLHSYDAALVCTPDAAKFGLLEFLLSNEKHVLVEKPLLFEDEVQASRLETLARENRVTCYTAYNHRFEPHIVRLRDLLHSRELGEIFMARLFYGNGTAREVRDSAWRDQGAGVLPDLGSHLLDITLFLFGPSIRPFVPWSCNRFENQAFDHVLLGTTSGPAIQLEMTLLSWRNTFTADIYAERGSAHIHGLCKWGPSIFTHRARVLPSGKPDQQSYTIERADPTWALEYEHFKKQCESGASNLKNDIWINDALSGLYAQIDARSTRGNS